MSDRAQSEAVTNLRLIQQRDQEADQPANESMIHGDQCSVLFDLPDSQEQGTFVNKSIPLITPLGSMEPVYAQANIH